MNDRRTLVLRRPYLSILLTIGVVAGCAQPLPPEPELAMPRAIVDLSPTITRDMPTRVVGEKTVAAFGMPLTTSSLRNFLRSA